MLPNIRKRIFRQEESEYEEGYLKNVKSIQVNPNTGEATILKQVGARVDLEGIHAVIKSGILSNVTFGYFYIQDDRWVMEFPHGKLGTLAKKGNKLIIEEIHKA